MRIYAKKIILSLFIVAGLAILINMLSFDFKAKGNIDYGTFSENTFDQLPNLTLPDETYISYTTFRNDIASTSAEILAINLGTWDKIIRFDEAEELYRFSVDVSYNLKYTTFETKLTQDAIERLLSLHYVLGRDIDYSVMKSKQFNPIGFDFNIDNNYYSQSFKGIFDGNGFEITNLYFSNYDLLTEILNEGTPLETEVAYTEYYAMFAYNEGIVRNFGLINPTYEFTFESSNLYKAANIVGKNLENGEVHHVYAIDYRSTALVAGIRMVATSGQASGVLFDNYGSFYDAYYAGLVIVNASYGSRFTVQPVLYENHATGTYSDLAFDDTLYQEIVTVSGSSYSITVPNGYATSLTTSQIRSSNATLGTDWYYFPSASSPNPKYPTKLGLDLVTTPLTIDLSDTPSDSVTLSSYYAIENTLDLIAFSKMLNYNRESSLTPFRDMNYVVTGDIDMQQVAKSSYLTPTVEFTGVFAGIDQETYIYGLELVNGMTQESYYAGMFGILRGQVYNLIFYNATLELNETDSYAGVTTYVGLIAGQMIDGTIRNVLADITIDLGHDTLGEMHVGGLVGQASGYVNAVYTEGDIIPNTDHTYRTDIVINPTYHFGGIIGSANSEQLILTDAFNALNIQGLGTTSSSINGSSAPIVYMGGVLGYAHNTLGEEHVLGMLTSTGTLYAEAIISAYTETYYIGGIIGQSAGVSYPMSNTFGKFYHMGTINPQNRGTNLVYAAGILNANHSEAVEFIHLFNEQEAVLDYYVDNAGTITGNMSGLTYATLIYNLGSTFTLSQSKNAQSINLYGITNYSGLYLSSSNQQTLLRFVENEGTITLKDQTLLNTVSIAGISLSENIDYLNVSFTGNIYAYNLVMQTNTVTAKQLFVAGIAQTLTMNRWIRNSIVSGEIAIGDITTNTSNLSPANNIYVAGFVNYNYSGNMDPNGNAAMPEATIGILNSINEADITSTYDTNHRGITGFANTYAGGLVTFNDGDIQDSANLGDVRFENLSNVDTSNVTYNTASTAGGATTKYRYGVVTGGISSAILSKKSRIYDSSNKGTIIALSRNFTRSGGILGMSIYNELTVGNVSTIYGSSSIADVEDSILSNCINYGDVSALTITISNYSMTSTWETMSAGITNPFRYDITMEVTVPSYNNTYYSALTSGSVRVYTRDATEERPGISASAGGVIGYGLSVMRRMVNHGQISSTDVAGGVVGATVVFLTAYVKIDTAINYGTVRAFDRGTSNANFYAVDIMDYETIRDGFYPVDSTFIFPDTHSDMRLYPENKRGFGGIFGRLQRAANQFMYGNNDANSTFNFIVNMDPNVDLIGRLDQVFNFYSSLRYFDFTNAVYYSARKNDTTQAVFTGISYFYDNSSNSSNSLYATRTNTNITITSRKYEYTYDSGSGDWLRTTYQKTTNRTEISLYGRRYERVGYDSASYENYQTEVVSRSAGPQHSDSGWSVVAGSTVAVGTLNEYKYEYDLPLYNQVWDIESTKVSGSSTWTQVPNGYYLFGVTLPVPLITEEASDPQGEYVYGSTFPMITDPILQEYTYFSENGNLSPTFIDARPNGMYVLATSSGSTFGSILPANLEFYRLLPLHAEPGELPSYDVDYENGTRIMTDSDPFYSALLTEYETLFQTMYSDKSQLLDGNDSSLQLHEVEGSWTRLYYPTVVQPTGGTPYGIITFDLDLQTLDFTTSNLATVNYEILGELLPNGAILAQTIEDYYNLAYGSDVSAYIADYRALLETYADPNIPAGEKPDLSPLWSYTFDINNPDTGLINLGYFSSYSEVAQYLVPFMNDTYITDYLVRLNVSYNVNDDLPYLYSYQIDGGTVRTTIVQNITVEPVDQRITFTFRNPDEILPVGTDILTIGTDNADNVVLEYYNPSTSSYITVNPEHYTITSSPVANATNYPFSFTLFVDGTLRGGQYRVGFRLLPYQDVKDYYTFTKGNSTLRTIEAIEHYSSGLVTPASTTFSTLLNFGYPLDFSSLTPVAVTDPLALPYQSDVLYYTLPFLNQLDISDFATISNVTVNSTTYTAGGFRIYNISYTLLAESGAQTVYNHQITERAIAITDVFRNNNKVTMTSLNPVQITREALETTVSINYGVDESYSSDIYNLVLDNPDSYFVIDPDTTVGFTFSVTEDYLVVTIDSSAEAGVYTFAVGYQRTGDPLIDLGDLYIRKLEGTNAYLTDIQFAELATETNYAKIYVSDSDGIPIVGSPYVPTIYYAGIDYDGSDDDGITDYRVDGQVSNIPLDEYIPYFLNYLPLGATISRQLPDLSWSAEVDGPDDTDIAGLAADFTSEAYANAFGDIIVTYRVTSEDGLNEVYYHITVTDVTYNVSYIFDVIYEGNALRPNINGLVVVINVRNMITDVPVGDTVVETLPTFTEVISYNNSTNLLYMVGFDNYKFRFGRNKSGFFSFNVKVLDPDGYIYDVEIELDGTTPLDSVIDFDPTSNDYGKYYYINASTKNRTRYFTITISNAQVAPRDYGFTDEVPSWD